MKKLTLILLVAVPALALADGEVQYDKSLQAEFFISQGIVSTSSNNVAGSGKGISFDKREIGGIMSYQLSDNIDFRGMATIEDYGNRYKDNLHVEYALVDLHHDLPAYTTTVGMRAGRVKNTMGLFNDKRTNPFLRETDFPPQSLYRDQLKHSAVSGDGLQLYMTKVFNSSALDLEVSKFKAELYPQDDAVNVLLNIPMGSGEFSKSDVTSFHATYKIPEYGVILKYDRLMLDFDYNANQSSPVSAIVPSGNMKTRIEYLSARKYFDKFDITGEVVKVTRSGELWNKILDGMNYGDPYAFNLVLRYRQDNWTFIAGYNVWFTDINDRDGSKHEQNTGISRHRYYQQDLNFGIRYKFNENWLAKFEYHKMRGTNVLSIVENPHMNQMNPRWDLISASLTYRF